MDLRFVEESDPTRQALLEIYAATILKTPYNDFENHRVGTRPPNHALHPTGAGRRMSAGG
jgi:hypothetical protein